MNVNCKDRTEQQQQRKKSAAGHVTINLASIDTRTSMIDTTQIINEVLNELGITTQHRNHD